MPQRCSGPVDRIGGADPEFCGRIVCPPWSERLMVQEELKSVSGDREVWVSVLDLLAS